MKSVRTFTIHKQKDKLEQDHILHYWDVETSGFVPIKYAESTDTTQVYKEIPESALLWMTLPGRLTGQRVFYIEYDSIKN